ncbi:MAG: leucine-rich repeat domain-containing protein [Prevotella sp.]|nr:leucine-rich repeat domain-containing protein [Prevotella sp.]
MNQSSMRAFIVLISVILLPLTASADAVEIDGIWYNLVNKSKTAELTRNPGVNAWTPCYIGDIVIPSKVTYESVEYDVTEIGDNAFGVTIQNNELTSIIIPNSVTTIGEYAFQNCSGLNSVTIPNSVTKIDRYAFRGCNSMTSISLSNNITNIAMSEFDGCSSLTSISIPDGVIAINDYAFRGCSSLQSIILPNSVTIIATYGFANCSGLKHISLSNNLTEIRGNAFNNCTNLTSITIPNNITIIDEKTFSGCTNLNAVIIGTGTRYLNYRCFANCDELTDVYCFAESVPTTNSNAFDNSYINLAKLHVPAASVSSYSASAPWSDFGTIDAITSENITIGDFGIGTFCGSNPLDLSGTEDVKAYVVSSYESATGQVTLTRTYYIPPFTGVVVKGNKGVYTIPAGVGQPVYPNMMKGVTTNTDLNKVDGDYTNYVLANKGGNLGFYAVSNGSTLGAGKAYLPLPTADLPSAAREITLIFDDGETTEIMKVTSQEKTSQSYYDLQGRRVANPTSGLYIVNGKKVIIK